jgi:hypothetical protein
MPGVAARHEDGGRAVVPGQIPAAEVEAVGGGQDDIARPVQERGRGRHRSGVGQVDQRPLDGPEQSGQQGEHQHDDAGPHQHRTAHVPIMLRRVSVPGVG